MTMTPPPPPSSAASKIFLAVAVTLGVLATILAFAFINSAGAGNTGPMKHIVVASHDLAPNQMIDPDRDLKVVNIPARFSTLAAMCLDWDSRSSYKGQRLNRDIQAEQPVMLGDLGGVGSLELQKPYYALTLPADTGIIIPGDYVKIVITKANVVNQGGTVMMAPGGMPYDSTIIGKDDGFKVLAVGGYLSKTRQQVLVSDQYSSNASQTKSVTLQVTEDQAKEITAALGSSSSSNKAILLLCPGPNTKPPTETPATPPTATKP